MTERKLSSSFVHQEVPGFVMQIDDDGVTMSVRCMKCQSSLKNLDTSRLKRHRSYCNRKRLFPNRSYAEDRSSLPKWTSSPVKNRSLREQEPDSDGNKARLGASWDASPIMGRRPKRDYKEELNDLVKYFSERYNEALQEVAELRLKNKALKKDNKRLASVLLRTQKKMNSLRYHLNGLFSISLVKARNPNYIV